MATLYYNAAVDTAWDTLGNWWNNIGFSDHALSLPANGDDVKIYAQMDTNPSSVVTLNSIYVNGSSIQVNFTNAYGDAEFYGDSTNYLGTVNGNATFNDHSDQNGTVTGNATFNDYSNNDGVVNGNATFNDSSYNAGHIYGDAVFNDNSFSSNDGRLHGTATFNDNSSNEDGIAYHDAIFNDNSHNAGGYVGSIYGNATFNDSSYNAGRVDGNATFNDSSYNNGGIVTGDATVYHPVIRPIGGEVQGTITYIGYNSTSIDVTISISPSVVSVTASIPI